LRQVFFPSIALSPNRCIDQPYCAVGLLLPPAFGRASAISPMFLTCC
jgi:hypothetical protein